VREGAGAAANELPVPSTHQTRCVSTWPFASGDWSPVMHAHPMPAISLGIIVRVGTLYDLYHWQTEAGELRASVGFDAGGTSHGHVQGPPAALRDLAAALTAAADQADASTIPTPALVEEVAG
jgi:hypothetical protein